MNGENRPLVADEPVKFDKYLAQTQRLITIFGYFHDFETIYGRGC